MKCWSIKNSHVQKMQVAEMRISETKSECPCGGQDEGRGTEIVWACEEELCGGCNDEV